MTYRRLFSLFFSLAISVFWLSQSTSAALLAIDYGTEFIKASVIKPGVPFDVLLNRDSKRKIQSSIAWKGEDRLFGGDAFNIAARFPGDSFTYLKLLQGVPYESDAVDVFRSINPSAQLVRTKRDTVGLLQSTKNNNTEWSVEELIAMQFSYIKELAETVGTTPDATRERETVRDAVVVVPPYFTQFERDAIADALEIAGLRLAALVNDGTAVSLNFAMTRNFLEGREWHVVYDAGAGGVRATVVSFETVQPNGKKAKDANGAQTQITVAGVGFDRTAGGLELSRRLRDMLALDFEVKHGRPVTGDARGMAKLWKEAERVKTILSANTEATASIESLAFDIDYRTKITRSSLEAACSDLSPKFAQPVLDAIANAGLQLDDIKSVILTGGHSRTPMVQASLKTAVGEGRIATSVNADEAAVLGAALYGASISPSFRTKDIKVADVVPYDIQISYLSQSKVVLNSNSNSDEEGRGGGEGGQIPLTTPRTLNTLVFPAGSKVGSKKTMTFKRKDDFNVTMSYKGSLGYGIPTDLLEAEITGVKEALAELSEAGATEPVVKATLVLSESGFAGIRDAVAVGEVKKDESFAGKLKGLFGGSNKEVGEEEVNDSSSSSSSSSSSTSSETSSTSTASGESDSASSSSQTTSSSSTTSASPSPEKKKEVRDTIPLTLTVRPLSIPALTPGEIRRSRDRLLAVDAAESAKRRLEEARNSLESYLYRLRDLLVESEHAYDEESESPFRKCSTEEERKVIEGNVDETLRWVGSEDAEGARLGEWVERRDRLERLERPIQFRYTEILAFPSTLNESQRINWMTRLFLTEARKNLTAELIPGNLPALHTSDELLTLEKALREHESWLHEGVEEQKRRGMNEDRAILTSEMKVRAKMLEKELMKLMRRKTPPKKKTSTSASSSSSSTSASSSVSESASGTGTGNSESVPPVEPTSSTTTSASENSPTSKAPDVHDEL
ncbi:actin-like ATPase domain-containing protein [Fomitiporia mediterranea MF3/22]|uniref:actin-like ATPase domain-containing protein n=1 Tax=Fomitiporia mediterranea (strain MF3/22) TaxID=694068 RepID=UPI00044099CF|nr:actin-like ATPase domain-containing protein [Fomitiporia mediterranea MF3/22]EJD05176.1 actin-like ATPase domain-containing protein [Fomitiporia mediterranea MF3/22]